jgi:hypothetical protein
MLSAKELSLFLTDPIYLIPAYGQSVSKTILPAKPDSSILPLTLDSGSATKAKTHVPPALLVAPVPVALGLAIIIHHPNVEETLPAEVSTMLIKLAGATKIDPSSHLVELLDASTIAWPRNWSPWPARLTLLMGWPKELLAHNRICMLYTNVPMGMSHFIATQHPTDLLANRTMRAQLWAEIQKALGLA